MFYILGMFLFRLLLGSAAVIMAFFMLKFALLGRVPRFVGSHAAISQAVGTYWMGRLATLAGAPLVFLLGIMLIGWAFTFEGRSAEDYRNMATRAAQKGNFGKAASYLSKVLVDSPDDVECLVLRAKFLRKVERYDAARADLDVVKNLDPGSPLPYSEEALICFAERDLPAAIENASKAIGMVEPDSKATYLDKLSSHSRTEAYYLRGYLRMTVADDIQGATEDLEAYLARDRYFGKWGDTDSRATKALVSIYRKSNRYQDALRVLGKYTTYHRLDFEDAVEHALLYGSSGNWTKAQSLLDQLVPRSEDRAYCLNLVAWALATNPDPLGRNGDLAIAYADRAVQESQRSVPSYIDTLAAAYAASGQFDKAVELEQQAIGAEKDKSSRNDYNARLSRFQKGEAHTEEWKPDEAPFIDPNSKDAVLPF